MKDYVCIDISSNLENVKVFEYVSLEFPDFTWHCGDSDSQGEYVSGVSHGGVKIECWTSESPMALSISFRNSNSDSQIREDILERVVNNLVPHLGELVKLDARKVS